MLHVSRPAVWILSALLCSGYSRLANAGDEFRFYHENVMGTSLELRVRADSREAAGWAESRVLGEIDRLAAIFSGYDKQSEFSRWQASQDVATKVSPELFEVLQASDRWGAWSGWAFDPRVEALTRLWSAGAAGNRLPTPDELAAARALMNRPAWRLDQGLRTARRLTACPLSLNGIAKGYIVERASNLAMEPGRGCRGLLLNVGGDLCARGEIKATVGIASPFADSESTEPFTYIEIENRSVATSGNSQRGFRIEDRWYSHIFDPRSGMPVDRVASATVIAERAVDADALAKVFNVLEPQESLRLARSVPGVECLIIASDGQVVRSEGRSKYDRPRPLALALADDPKRSPPGTKQVEADKAEPKDRVVTPWNKDYELVVNFEINQPQSTRGRYRRPYVAVWVEDKDGAAIRTLALWVSMGGAGPFQWLPDLKRWYKNDEARKRLDPTDIFFTVSRPTRPAGKYKVIWDGKDDHDKQRGGGEYVVWIEAAREHGTYQSMRRRVTLADKPFTEDIKGNVEIKSATIEYRRKAPPK
jgi:FAD:protein FMN transferase